MQTHKSFLAFAAVAQLVNPPAGAMSVRRRRPPALHLSDVLLQAEAGRDIHFHNDLSTGRLSILDLRYAAAPAAGMPAADILRGARQAAGGRHGHEMYMYSLTRQVAIGNAAELRRYMDWYGAGGGLSLPAAARDGIELLRLRFGVYAPRG